MPALRKSGRGPRSSTTPYASPTGTPSDSKEKSQRSIMEWAEPSIQNPTPSFEEHGFARHGVLEQMAPLGQPPSAKVKQRTRAMGGDAAARKSLAGKGSFLGDEVGSTPEVTPAPELEPDDSERQEEDDLPLELPPQEEDEDDDYVPGKTKKKTPVSKAMVRGKPPAQGKTPGEAKTPVKAGTPGIASEPASPAVQAVEAPRDTETSQRAQIALLAAAESAQANQNPRLGEALQQLRALSRKDPTVAFMIDAIVKQNQTPEQWTKFRENIKALKKSSKKKRKHQQRNGDLATVKDESPRISQQPSPRPSSEVAPDDSVSFVHENDVAMEDISPAADSTAGALPSPHPLSTAPTLPAIEPSIETVPRQPSKSPRKKHATNGYLAPSSEMDVDGGASSAVQTPAANTPEAGDGSDSELSEVNEEIVQKGPPTPAQSKEKASTPVPAAAKKGKPTGAGRGGKKHANKGKLFGKHAHKNLPASNEPPEDLEQIYQLRKEMADAQPLRQFELPFPQSDVRFDDEILETESLTESMIAVGPPVDSDQPRRAGRVPQGAKRLREDMSRFSSPQLESATISRPTTPAVQPAIKRIKLNNGQAARTKRSPVKNRDGGPIAGVAFNGGGVARQLGPDDNDPNSPASESDDLCSACRGAGEFVCCEGCPRVFHLLCCDPPRVQVPEGSFYCYDCTVRLSPPEEPAETFAGLGPLFTLLEKTNPRAFALPRDVQTHFEDVSARGDGSYFEDIKKFPLAKSSGYGYQKPDYTKVLDGDKPILCVQCGVSSGGKRQMLKCDFCNAHWHLDCVDPPLANPPHISLEASQRDAWKCPRHVDHDLRSGLLLQNDLNGLYDDVEMGDATFTRVPRKIRRRKQPEIVEPTFSRGMRNNGLIDIINDSDDDTDGEGNYTGFEFKDVNSKVYRVPERGLITDFLTKVKSQRITRDHEAQDAYVAAQRKASMQNFVTHSFQQQQAALNLALLARKEQDIGLSEGNIDSLVLILTAEAPQEVIAAMANSAPPPVASDERAQLLKLQELIQRRLNAS